jgi:hypothetical protein
MLRQELLDSALNQLAAGHGRQQDCRQHIERELNPCFSHDHVFAMLLVQRAGIAGGIVGVAGRLTASPPLSRRGHRSEHDHQALSDPRVVSWRCASATRSGGKASATRRLSPPRATSDWRDPTHVHRTLDSARWVTKRLQI